MTMGPAPMRRIVFGAILLKLAIARGGMGDVYLAATTGIEGAERPCIVKTVRRDHIHDGSFLARFLDEARVQSQLQHPGVAQVLEAATDENGEPYTVVEYVEGRSLATCGSAPSSSGCGRLGRRRRHRRSRWRKALATCTSARGRRLAARHRAPRSVAAERDGRLRGRGEAHRLRHRARPQPPLPHGRRRRLRQARLRRARVARQQVGDGRIDLYALGIMLWELCAGRRFLTGDPQKHLDDAAAASSRAPGRRPSAAPRRARRRHRRSSRRTTPTSATRAGRRPTWQAARVGAATGKNGERGVRGAHRALMRTLWPHEPARSRAEFARSARGARDARRAERAARRPRRAR
jgi:hypothetical protein